MASIELKGLTKQFGALTAVDALDLEIRDREFVALLGPSGCGKTTTMNMIAGIETPSEGRILFDGRDMAHVHPRKRGVGFVFQSYAVFTHLSVYRNLSFGLEVAGTPKAEIARRVREIAMLLDLERQLDTNAAILGVNELQRLAIGRSAVVNPKIFLLDEPLSNLDAAFRAVMRTELKHLQHELGQTMVYVTHDQLEAMTMADRIAVMNLGVLQQYGTPLEIYNRPRNTFVARFMGSPSMNLLYCRMVEDGDRRFLDFDESGRIALEDESLLAQSRNAAQPDLYLGVRPESVSLRAAGDGPHVLAMTVVMLERIGARTIVHLRSADHELKVVEPADYDVEVGMPVEIRMEPGAAVLFDGKSGLALGTA
jgi:multiple sugar transport system ATP-binding protein